MQQRREILVDNTLMAVTGRSLKIARLRHEWFEYLVEPQRVVNALQAPKPIADIFTFLQEAHNGQSKYPFYTEIASASVLPIRPFAEWFKKLDPKARNKIRKAQKSGLELREVQLDDAFVRGVESIYNESAFRQGRKFLHYGKSAAVIKDDLSSFPGCTFFIGAYFREELIGFMKLFRGNNILRTVHIIAKLSERDKPVMDALIAKAVEICNEEKISFLHYGDWTSGGLGQFRVKHGFEKHDCPRYFVPLTWRGKSMLRLKLHRPLRDYLPQEWLDRMIARRNRRIREVAATKQTACCL